MSTESYSDSMVIESFLRTTLKVKPGSRTDQFLHNTYHSIVLWEEGYGAIPPSEYKKLIQRLVRHFDKAIDKLSKKHPRLAMNAHRIKERMPYMESSADVLELYQTVQQLTK
jgi:hypothetical protein